MTKEEAIKILTGYMGGKIDPESTELYHAIELVVDILESQLSPPSNIDEAAEEFGKRQGVELAPFAKKFFKARAEWMAGQGEVFEGTFKAGDAGYPDFHMGEQYSIEYIEHKPKGVKPGDEVIVQIRKK